MADPTPSLDEILAEIEENYRRFGGPTRFQLPAPPPAPEPPPPEPSLLEKAGGLAGEAYEGLKYPWQEIYEARYRELLPGVPEERIPSPGKALEAAAFGGEPTTFGGGAAHELVGAVGNILTDPAQMALIGGAGGGSKLLQLGLAGMMGVDMYHRARKAVDDYQRGGMSPELGRDVGGFLLDAALIAGPTAARRLMRPAWRLHNDGSR